MTRRTKREPPPQLGVTNRRMVREEEAPEQGVHAQETRPRKRYPLRVGLLQVSIGLERRPLLAEPIQHIDVVLGAEVLRPNRPGLQLQHQLANHALLVAGP